VTNRYEEASEGARKLLGNFDEIDLAEMLASSNATAATLNARITELEADLARVQQAACSSAESLRKADASRHTAIRRAILLSRHQGLLVAIREFVAEETTPTNGWGDGYRDAKRDLVEILDAFAPDAIDQPQQPEGAEAPLNP
jgi:hypothetical protein